MTLEETKEQWKVSYERLCEWLDLGIIPDTEIVNGKVEIHGEKPFVPKKNAKITVDSVRRYILQACNSMKYIDYRILCIEPERFKSIILQLEQNEYIQRDIETSDYLSNKHFTITELGETALNKKKFKLSKLDFDIGFSYKMVTVNVGCEFERSTK